jgi:N-acetylglucosamine-6-phosphate deacetylase
MPDGPFAIVGDLMRGPLDPVPGAVIVEDGKIVAIESPAVMARLPPRPLRCAFIAPGFIDLQVNGGFGFEVGPDPDALRALCERLPSTGVVAFLPTLISATEDDYRGSLSAFRALMDAPPRTGSARPWGLHLEGPLLAPGRAGAHDRAIIEAARVDLLERLADPAWVRLVTLAPEREGALALIARLKDRGLMVALGHTDASFETFVAGVDAGATLATHLFNAMSPFHHREPAATGAALTDDRVTALMIADGVHSHPAAFRLAARAKGIERLALVTDAIAGAGLPPGGSRLAGREVVVDQTSARLADGRLAGSILTMDQAVRNAVAFGGLTPAAAVHMASAVPARAAGRQGAGCLAVGADADIVLLDLDLNVEATFVNGARAYVRHPE